VILAENRSRGFLPSTAHRPVCVPLPGRLVAEPGDRGHRTKYQDSGQRQAKGILRCLVPAGKHDRGSGRRCRRRHSGGVSYASVSALWRRARPGPALTRAHLLTGGPGRPLYPGGRPGIPLGWALGGLPRATVGSPQGQDRALRGQKGLGPRGVHWAGFLL